MSTPHDSVVARPTFCRTVQIESMPLHGGLTATLPSTVNEKGVVVSNVLHPAFKTAKLGLQDDGGNNNNNNSPTIQVGEMGSFLQGELGEISMGPSASMYSRSRQAQNRIVEIDVQPPSTGQTGKRSAGVGFAPTAGLERGSMSKSQADLPRTGN